MSALTVEKVWEGRDVTHYRVSSGHKGGEQVTVRVGLYGVFACLGRCLSVECEHAMAVREFAGASKEKRSEAVAEVSP